MLNPTQSLAAAPFSPSVCLYFCTPSACIFSLLFHLCHLSLGLRAPSLFLCIVLTLSGLEVIGHLFHGQSGAFNNDDLSQGVCIQSLCKVTFSLYLFLSPTEDRAACGERKWQTSKYASSHSWAEAGKQAYRSRRVTNCWNKCNVGTWNTNQGHCVHELRGVWSTQSWLVWPTVGFVPSHVSFFLFKEPYSRTWARSCGAGTALLLIERVTKPVKIRSQK